MRFAVSILTLLLTAAVSALPAQEAAKVEKRCCTHDDQLECELAAAINPQCRNNPGCIEEMEEQCFAACGGVDC